MKNKTHICEVCGHEGADVKLYKNPRRTGFFCKDGMACLDRFHRNLQTRSQTHFENGSYSITS